MEDVKWLLKKCGFPILVLALTVIIGIIYCEKLRTTHKKIAEEVWEPPVEISGSEMKVEENVEGSQGLEYGFNPQASDCLISDMEKEHLQKRHC